MIRFNRHFNSPIYVHCVSNLDTTPVYGKYLNQCVIASPPNINVFGKPQDHHHTHRLLLFALHSVTRHAIYRLTINVVVTEVTRLKTNLCYALQLSNHCSSKCQRVVLSHSHLSNAFIDLNKIVNHSTTTTLTMTLVIRTCAGT